MNKAEKIIQECKVTGEPYFVIRAKDLLSVNAITDYKILSVYQKCSDEFINDLDRVIEDFEIWQKYNPTKLKNPD